VTRGGEAGVVDRHDVGMRGERSEGPALLLEPATSLGVEVGRVQDLDGDDPPNDSCRARYTTPKAPWPTRLPPLILRCPARVVARLQGSLIFQATYRLVDRRLPTGKATQPSRGSLQGNGA